MLAIPPPPFVSFSEGAEDGGMDRRFAMGTVYVYVCVCVCVCVCVWKRERERERGGGGGNPSCQHLAAASSFFDQGFRYTFQELGTRVEGSGLSGTDAAYLPFPLLAASGRTPPPVSVS